MTGRLCIPVSCIEFDVGGNTLWVQAPGGTALRIKTFGGKFLAEDCKTSPVSHADIQTTGDVRVCIGTEDGAARP